MGYKCLEYLLSNGWMGKQQYFMTRNLEKCTTIWFGTKSDWPYWHVEKYVNGNVHH